jgi:hypothetical protein
LLGKKKQNLSHGSTPHHVHEKKINWQATLFPVRIHMLGVRGKKILKTDEI